MQPVSPTDLNEYTEHLTSQGLSPATVARKKASLTKFKEWAMSHGFVSQEQKQTIVIEPEFNVVPTQGPNKLAKYFLFAVVGLTMLVAILILDRQTQVFRLLTSRASLPVSEPSPTPEPIRPPKLSQTSAPTATVSAQPIATANVPLTVDSHGVFVLASENPTLQASSGTFKILGESISLVTSPFSHGNITVAPDGEGQFLVRSTTSNKNSLDVRNANLTTGSLIYGNVGNTNTTYDFLRFTNGPGEKLHFEVDANGNTYIGGNATVDEKLLVDEIKAKDASRILIDNPITFQDAGTISTTNGNLNLQPSGIVNIPVAISNVSPSNAGRVQIKDDLQIYGSEWVSGGLDVNGRAIFNDQLELGRFTSNPSAIGQGTLIFNTGDTSLYLWNGTSWVNLGGAGTSGFWQRNSGALSPTNITDDLLIGGIATSSALLQVVGTGAQRGQVVGTNSTNATAAYVTFTNLGTGNSFVVNDEASDTTPFIIDASGNVGIGTTTPGTALDLGGASAVFQFSGTGTHTISNSSTNTALTITSNAAGALTVDSGTTGTVNLGTGNNAKIINIGTGTAGNTINIGTNNTTADTIGIGSALDTLNLTGATVTLTLGSDATGDIWYRNSSGNVTRLPIGTAGQALTVVAGIPSWAGGSGGTGTSGFWQRNSGALSPANITDDVLVGGIATSSALFQVVGSGAQRGQVVGTNTTDATAAYVTFTNLGSGNSLVINDAPSDTTPFVIDASGNVGIGDSTPLATLTVGSGDLFQVAGATGNIITSGDAAINGGDITSSGALNINSGGVGALTLTSASGNLTLGAGTNTIINTDVNTAITIDPNGTGNVNFHGSTYQIQNSGDFIGQRFLDSANNTFLVDPANTGTSVSLVGGSQILFSTTGSIATTTNNTLSLVIGTGKVCVGSVAGTCDGKIDVATVDPPYTIDGLAYATFAPSMTGVKEETAGSIATTELVPGLGYRTSIDFIHQPQGSDLWLFSRTTNLKENIENLVVLLTPQGNTKTWYQVDPNLLKLFIYTSKPAVVSYRLTAPRFDWARWPNTRPEDDGTNIGLILHNGKWEAPEGVDEISQTPENPPQIVKVGGASGLPYLLQNASGQVIEEISSLSQAFIANLEAGLIQTHKLVTPLARIDEIQTDTISPIATDSGGIAVKLGPTQTFGIYNKESSPAAIFDSSGNATLSGELTAREASISGTLYADRIVASFGDLGDRLGYLEASVSGISTGSPTATTSATAIPDLTVTNQFTALGNSSLGPTSIAGSLLVDGVIALSQRGIDFLGDTLYILRSRLASLDILDGIVRISPIGKIFANADVDITGKTRLSLVSPLPGNDLTLSLEASQSGSPTTSPASPAGGFGKLLVKGQNDSVVAAIDSSGNATFAGELAAHKLVIALDAEASPSAQAQSIVSNATVGTGTVPAGLLEVTIPTNAVTSKSYVYITPISSTNNHVLYVKSKTEGYGFVVGFDTPETIDVQFNWWVIN